MCLISSGSPFCQGVPGGCAPGNRLKPGSCAAFRVVPFFARGVPGGCAPGNRLKPGSCAAFRVVPSFAKGSRGLRAREPLGTWFMCRISSGSLFRQGAARQGTARNPVHVPHFERFPLSPGGSRGLRAREPLETWFMCRISSGSLFRQGVPGGCARGNRSKPGSCAAFRVVPSFARGFQGAARQGTARNLVHVPHFERFPFSPGGSRGLRAREPLETRFMCRISSGSFGRGRWRGHPAPGAWQAPRILSIRGCSAGRRRVLFCGKAASTGQDSVVTRGKGPRPRRSLGPPGG